MFHVCQSVKSPTLAGQESRGKAGQAHMRCENQIFDDRVKKIQLRPDRDSIQQVRGPDRACSQPSCITSLLRAHGTPTFPIRAMSALVDDEVFHPTQGYSVSQLLYAARRKLQGTTLDGRFV
jgi:hypothetical protein